jgi:hypothetical protein
LTPELPSPSQKQPIGSVVELQNEIKEAEIAEQERLQEEAEKA